MNNTNNRYSRNTCIAFADFGLA